MPLNDRPFADRQFERRDAGTETRWSCSRVDWIVSAFEIELVDEHHPGHAHLVGDLPHIFGLHLHAFDRAHDEDGEVAHAQRRDHVTDEVGVSRRVDEIDLVVFPLERRHRQRQRQPAPLLFGVVVAYGGPLIDAAHASGDPGAMQQGLGQRRLAGAAVADKHHVADVRRRIALHHRPPCRPPGRV